MLRRKKIGYILPTILIAFCASLQLRTMVQLLFRFDDEKDVLSHLPPNPSDITNITIFSRKKATLEASAHESILHVFQYGVPLTASATQFHMVCVSLFLHVRIYHSALMNSTICSLGRPATGEEAKVKFHKDVPQAFKSHAHKPDPTHFEKSTVIFTTHFTKAEAAKQKADLRNQGFNVGIVHDADTMNEIGISGMVKQYADFFSLGHDYIDLMTEYFQQWHRLRECCGMQMSTYFRNELLPASDKVNGTKPHDYCGSLDINILEAQFMNMVLYKLLNDYPFMKKINRPSIVDGDLNGSYCSRYNDAVRKHGNTGNKDHEYLGLNSMYAEVENNWKERHENFFDTLKKKSAHNLPRADTHDERLQWSIENSPLQPPFSPWVQDYISFHQSSIVDGNLSENAQYIVYECKNGKISCGGAGDRMIGMIKMFYLALCTRRVLIIDAPFPIPLTDVFIPAQIEWNATFPVTLDYFDDMDYFIDFGLREDIRGYRVPRTNDAPRKKSLDEIWESSLMADHLRKGGWSEEAKKVSVANIAREAYRAMFQFHRAVISRASDLKAAAGISGPYVGMHMRKGDQNMGVSPAGPKFVKRETHDDEMLHCYSQLMASHPNEFKMAYLASDDVLTKQRIASKDSSIHFAQLNPFHIDKSTRESRAVDPATVYSGVLDTWAEMLVMAESTCLIISKSMFAFSSLHMRDPRACAVPLNFCNDPDHRKGDKEYFVLSFEASKHNFRALSKT
eukprot:CCRYP_012016-RB/>CCRYP_012016-RB protein AED:0.04 eAED:0.04 QI:128/1/1/1/0/0.5/2/187/735